MQERCTNDEASGGTIFIIHHVYGKSCGASGEWTAEYLRVGILEALYGVGHRELLIEIVLGRPLIVLGFELTTDKAKPRDNSACVKLEIASIAAHALLYFLVEQIVDAVAQLPREDVEV